MNKEVTEQKSRERKVTGQKSTEQMPTEEKATESMDLSVLIEPLQTWFDQNARVLPWREEPTAYYVWISEIMLQQTRVEAVKPYFQRFITKLPDIEALADCPEDRLLKLWEGLGYYNRARNLKLAAIQIMEEYEGRIPSDYKELLKLKGIGPYTAGAISSIAYGLPVPAVDGNVLRVISRVTADESDIARESVKKAMEQRLYTLMNSVQDGNIPRLIPSKWNQALMELGATVCIPNGEPHCDKCPWNAYCQAKIRNLTDRIPVKTSLKKRRIENKTVLILKDGQQLALRKRPDRGLLAGLYELPNLEGEMSEEEVLQYIKDMGYEPVRIRPVGEAKHIFSHVEWHMKGYVVFLSNRGFSPEDSRESSLIFVDAEEVKDRYAIPSAFAAYTGYLNLILGKDAL